MVENEGRRVVEVDNLFNVVEIKQIDGIKNVGVRKICGVKNSLDRRFSISF